MVYKLILPPDFHYGIEPETIKFLGSLVSATGTTYVNCGIFLKDLLLFSLKSRNRLIF